MITDKLSGVCNFLQPLELSTIQARLKTAGVSIGRERLADVLDHWVSQLPPLCQSPQAHGPKLFDSHDLFLIGFIVLL